MIKKFSRSLSDLIGAPYCRALSDAAKVCGISDDGWKLGNEKIRFITDEFLTRQEKLLSKIGHQVVGGLSETESGAPSAAFKKASALHAAPIGGIGFVRIGEDGRCYLAAKSEHYHASLGHGFPGFELLSLAARMGVSNATHNNSRGHITRLLEKRLIEIANGPRAGDEQPRPLERVINIQTGSLAVEAGVKIMLSRFYRQDSGVPQPPYSGRIPVFLVVGDFNGGKTANYHGTTTLTQGFRDLWPDFNDKLRLGEVYETIPVKINDFADFAQKVEKYDTGKYKIAGFLHEILLMNYGEILLDESYLQKAYALCHSRDIPILVDEVQTGVWVPDYFMYHRYNLKPDMVTLGKGFSGGRFSASKIIITAPMDTLGLFGALVTNGQEELSSLAYLITMEFAAENADHIKNIGTYNEERLVELKNRYPEIISTIE
ncbi:MAG: aminotransferase class III-fold pyridoxal phosphate-dependent enzyme, partial [Spirochaetales bacterium]|nr:aminotransferase class III-fold pyridoxal phosphate-dependent enzyme [Spirochaetales bacterium]